MLQLRTIDYLLWLGNILLSGYGTSGYGVLLVTGIQVLSHDELLVGWHYSGCVVSGDGAI